MSDDEQSPNLPAGGQAEAAPWSQGTTESAPQPPEGQAAAPIHSPEPGQAEGTQATGELTFFDPQALPPELIPAYKQMQAAFTVKTQDISRSRQKIEAYDAFMRDPVGQIQSLASQYGMQLTRAQAQQVQQEAQSQQKNWEPQTWDELLTKAEERAEQRVMQRLSPYLGEVQKMQATNIEKQLSSIDPEWRTYENNMRDVLAEHPTMVKDVAKLYRLAVPPEVLEAKAIQGALKKFEDKGKHIAVTSGGSAPRSKPAASQVKSFDEAYQEAKRKILSGEV